MSCPHERTIISKSLKETDCKDVCFIQARKVFYCPVLGSCISWFGIPWISIFHNVSCILNNIYSTEIKNTFSGCLKMNPHCTQSIFQTLTSMTLQLEIFIRQLSQMDAGNQFQYHRLFHLLKKILNLHYSTTSFSHHSSSWLYSVFLEWMFSTKSVSVSWWFLLLEECMKEEDFLFLESLS